MKQKEIIKLAMLGVMRLQDEETDLARKLELNEKMKELARLLVEEELKQYYLSLKC